MNNEETNNLRLVIYPSHREKIKELAKELANDLYRDAYNADDLVEIARRIRAFIYMTNSHDVEVIELDLPYHVIDLHDPLYLNHPTVNIKVPINIYSSI